MGLVFAASDSSQANCYFVSSVLELLELPLAFRPWVFSLDDTPRTGVTPIRSIANIGGGFAEMAREHGEAERDCGDPETWAWWGMVR